MRIGGLPLAPGIPGGSRACAYARTRIRDGVQEARKRPFLPRTGPSEGPDGGQARQERPPKAAENACSGPWRQRKTRTSTTSTASPGKGHAQEGIWAWEVIDMATNQNQ